MFDFDILISKDHRQNAYHSPTFYGNLMIQEANKYTQNLNDVENRLHAAWELIVQHAEYVKSLSEANMVDYLVTAVRVVCQLENSKNNRLSFCSYDHRMDIGKDLVLRDTDIREIASSENRITCLQSILYTLSVSELSLLEMRYVLMFDDSTIAALTNEPVDAIGLAIDSVRDYVFARMGAEIFKSSYITS